MEIMLLFFFSCSHMSCRALRPRRSAAPPASKIHRCNCCLGHPLQTTFLEEKAVIVQSVAQMAFATLYAFLQYNPINRTLKAPANWSSAFIQHKSDVCNWALALYLSSPFPPLPLHLVSYECTTTMAWVMGPKCLYFFPPLWTKSLCGS